MCAISPVSFGRSFNQARMHVLCCISRVEERKEWHLILKCKLHTSSLGYIISLKSADTDASLTHNLDIMIEHSQAKEILRTRANLNQLYVHHTGREIEEIEKVMDRDTFMDVNQAVDFGVIDEILEKRPLTGDEQKPTPI